MLKRLGATGLKEAKNKQHKLIVAIICGWVNRAPITTRQHIVYIVTEDL